MLLHSAASTHVGMRREQNQDRYALVPELGLYLVADGMGGHTGGQIASRLACEAAIGAVETLQGAAVSPAERLRHAVAHANREIMSATMADPTLEGMGTTFVGLLFFGKRLALAHVGDSRAYLLRNGRLRALTDDHSIVAELVRRQQISAEDAREHPHRHVLTRALGIRGDTEADLAEMTPQPGDVFMLCTDGLNGHVEDDEIASLLTQNGDLEATAEQLVESANRAGGLDNTTVVLIRYEKDA